MSSALWTYSSLEFHLRCLTNQNKNDKKPQMAYCESGNSFKLCRTMLDVNSVHESDDHKKPIEFTVDELIAHAACLIDLKKKKKNQSTEIESNETIYEICRLNRMFVHLAKTDSVLCHHQLNWFHFYKFFSSNQSTAIFLNLQYLFFSSISLLLLL